VCANGSGTGTGEPSIAVVCFFLALSLNRGGERLGGIEKGQYPGVTPSSSSD